MNFYWFQVLDVKRSFDGFCNSNSANKTYVLYWVIDKVKRFQANLCNQIILHVISAKLNVREKLRDTKNSAMKVNKFIGPLQVSQTRYNITIFLK